MKIKASQKAFAAILKDSGGGNRRVVIWYALMGFHWIYMGFKWDLIWLNLGSNVLCWIQFDWLWDPRGFVACDEIWESDATGRSSPSWPIVDTCLVEIQTRSTYVGIASLKTRWCLSTKLCDTFWNCFINKLWIERHHLVVAAHFETLQSIFYRTRRLQYQQFVVTPQEIGAGCYQRIHI